MRKIKAVPITKENFAPYGSFSKITAPEGFALGDFFPDQARLPVSGRMPITFSPLLTHKPEKMIVTTAEYHNFTGEGVVAMDDDVVLHVAPASGDPIPQLTEAFIVPKGTVVCINPGVWHYAALNINVEEGHVMIVLPERTYKNDCVVVNYPEEDWVEIEL